jgi:hypothetical protein
VNRFLYCAVILLLVTAAPMEAARGREGYDNPSAALKTATIIYEDVATEVTPAATGATELWITTADLTRATRFELKPQGVCRDQLCFPVPKARAAEFTRKEGQRTLFNLLAFARLVKQPVAHDEALATWYFGQRADQREALASLQAPDFTLPDMSGKMHSLSALRGKKVLLVTWASW